MDAVLSSLELPTAAWALAFSVSVFLYASMRFFGSQHLTQDSKDNLALWLSGCYQASWATKFCEFFDSVFGKNHFSWQCFFRSAVLSLIAVSATWYFAGPTLGLLDWRTTTSFGFVYVIIIGSAINILPDYISLVQTRWLIYRIGKIDNFRIQLFIIFLDLAFSAAIMGSFIFVFILLIDNYSINWIELIGLFSFYSIFFYSAFATSLWAWIYLLSTFVMRLFASTPLKKLMPIYTKPVEQLALVISFASFIIVLTTASFLRQDDDRYTIDEHLCIWFPAQACPLVSRLTSDRQEAWSYIARACEGGGTEYCMGAAILFFGNNPAKAAELFEHACAGGNTRGCESLARSYMAGDGVVQDYGKAESALRRAIQSLDRNRSPIEWSRLQKELGDLILHIVASEGIPSFLEKAVLAYRFATELPELPENLDLWMEAQYSLAETLIALGRLNKDKEMILEGSYKYEMTLERIERDMDPFKWAGLHYNIGSALYVAGDLSQDILMLEQSIIHFDLAFEVYKKDEYRGSWARNTMNRSVALSSIGKLKGNKNYLFEAIDGFYQIGEIWTRNDHPNDWGITQGNIADALFKLAVLENDAFIFERSASHFENSLSVVEKSYDLGLWIILQKNIGDANYFVGTLSQDQEALKKSQSALAAALSEMKELSDLDDIKIDIVDKIQSISIRMKEMAAHK